MPFLLISFTSDWLYPTGESVAIADALRSLERQVTHVELETDAGHDAFLIDYAQQAPLIEEFLAGIRPA
jgi:homoserine O-acetyltransferase